MAASVDSILKYLPRLLPEIKVNPLPEVVFLFTIKALVVPASGLSLAQWATIGSIILLTNISPTLRKATVKLYGYLSLIIGAEIALINAYVLVGVTILSPPGIVNSFCKGLFMDFTLDDTATFDSGHLERPE
jgi:hypothetical protein